MDDFKVALQRIVHEDPRYDRDAYLFMRDALDHTQKSIAKSCNGKLRHITGQELLEGIREFALQEYGPMTLSVLNEWGIYECKDFGEIVFNLVEHDLLRKTEDDQREDFHNGYDFFEAFRKPFLPTHRLNNTSRRHEPSR